MRDALFLMMRPLRMSHLFPVRLLKGVKTYFTFFLKTKFNQPHYKPSLFEGVQKVLSKEDNLELLDISNSLLKDH